MHLKFITPIILLMLAAMAVSTGGNNESRVDSIPTGMIIQDNAGLGEAFAGIDAENLSKGLARLEADLHPTPTPTPKPTPEPQPAIRASHTHSSSSSIKSIIIRTGKSSPVIILGIDDSGAMETPELPSNVAWYDFTALPGTGGNTVFAAHVDTIYYNGRDEPGAFYNLKNLNPGDIIEVVMRNGDVYRYVVTTSWSVDYKTTDVSSIIGGTSGEVITLITCGGGSGTNYDQRLIVRAERLGQ